MTRIRIADIDYPETQFKTDEIPPGLLESIERHGLLRPINVIPQENGRYLIVNGLARLRACDLLGLREIDCIIFSVVQTWENIRHMR